MAKPRRKRSGHNPTKNEVQLRGALAGLQSMAQKLTETNKVLTGEASTILEALWNGHQELVVEVKELRERVSKLEGNEETHVEEESETTEDAVGDLQDSEDAGREGPVHSGEEGSESGEVPEDSGDGGVEAVPEEGGPGEREGGPVS